MSNEIILLDNFIWSKEDLDKICKSCGKTRGQHIVRTSANYKQVCKFIPRKEE